MATIETSAGLSDYGFIARSKPIGALTAGTYTAVYLPKYAFVEEVWVVVKTVASAGDVTIGLREGSTTDTDMVMAAEEANVDIVGVTKASSCLATGFDGYWFTTSSGAITLTAGTTLTSGKFYVVVRYSILH